MFSRYWDFFQKEGILETEQHNNDFMMVKK